MLIWYMTALCGRSRSEDTLTLQLSGHFSMKEWEACSNKIQTWPDRPLLRIRNGKWETDVCCFCIKKLKKTTCHVPGHMSDVMWLLIMCTLEMWYWNTVYFYAWNTRCVSDLACSPRISHLSTQISCVFSPELCRTSRCLNPQTYRPLAPIAPIMSIYSWDNYI